MVSMTVRSKGKFGTQNIACHWLEEEPAMPKSDLGCGDCG